ncbi:MAG: acetyltransferase [Bacteroidales bacterium]|nr:acetyltransferase [Bacteroidales bacterium]
MKTVIIIGAGGHAAEIDDYIKYSQSVTGKRELNVIGFLDDNPDNYAGYRLSAPLLGGIKGHKVAPGQAYIIGIANLKYRRLFVERFLAGGAVFVSFIHPSVYMSESATIGEGSIVGPNANLGPNVKIGNYTLINSRCSMGHDTVVGDFNFISPNVCFSGFTSVGNDNLFGINSATIPGISVGNRNKIAAGMVLDNNVGDDSVVFHRFKEKVIAIPKQSQS